MKKYIALFAVLVLVGFAISGIALAKADVQKLVPYPFPPFGEEPRDPDASGKAIVNEPKGDVVLVITVSAKGLEPETTYQVKSCTSSTVADWTLLGTLTTNKNGNGHFHINYREGMDLPPTAHVYINTGPGVTVLMDEDYE